MDVSRPIYPLPSAPRLLRDRPMKVLAVGLSRTGTESLKQALSLLGYDHVYHGFDFLKKPEQVYPWVQLLERKLAGETMPTQEAFDDIVGDCEAVTDLPCSALAVELFHAYPDAKVIINYRKSVDDWFRSYAVTVDPLVTNWLYSFRCMFDAEAYWARRLVRDVQQIHYDGNFARNGKIGYNQHYERVRAATKQRAALEWSVQDGWVPLCDFLGKAVPDIPFPHGNDPAAFEDEKIKITLERFARCDRNIRVVFGLSVAVIIAIFAMI